MSGGGDWSDSLFKPEKGDSLGDGSWGRESEEPELTPVAWDKLPEVSSKDKVRARLATPAPGSQKESGLLDIKALAPDLAKSMKDGEPVLGPPRQNTPAPGGARLATAAKGSAGSGLIDVNDIVRAQEELKAKRASSEGIEAFIESAGSPTTKSSSLIDQPVARSPQPDLEASGLVPPSRSPLFMLMGLLALAVAGLAIYVFTQ